MPASGADFVNGDKLGYQDVNEIKNNYRLATEPASIQPGMLFSNSADEKLYHAQAAARKRILQETDSAEFVETRLGSVQVDLNAAGGTPLLTTLYTCPAGKSCIVTAVILRSCSGNMTTAKMSFGWDANGTDVIVDALHTALTGPTRYEKIIPIAGAKIGTAAGTFKAAVNTKQGGAMTVQVSVVGYIY
jgi:hypothetical protein